MADPPLKAPCDTRFCALRGQPLGTDGLFGQDNQGADLLRRARRVEIDIAHEGERVSEVWKAVVHRDEVEKSLRLSPQMGVGEGDAIAVRVWDADTGELLAHQPAVVQVALDW